MNNLKSLFIVGLIIVTSILSTFASETRNMVLQGGFSANTQAGVLIHNALPITVRFKVRRDGSDNNFAERQIRFQLISPNGETKTLIRSIGATEETLELSLPAAGGGNAVRTWKAEMRNLEASANEEVSQSVRGTVEFFTTGSNTTTISAPTKFGLVQSDSATKTINMPFTGNLTIQANWDTDEITLENYKLKFELYKGNTKLAADTGYSRDSIIIGVSESQRMKISYQVKATDFQISGDWKVKVYGSSKGKVKNIVLKMKIVDGLFE
ncbi:MAG TPA: hypothetical protein PKY82_33210 [Pyrinomonadaceae bacterium]|nr:hypothetical protein [Pyrinomonadaceae bacterium]